MKAATAGTVLMLLLAPEAFGQTRLGGEFQVNSYTTGTQRYPDVAVGPDGRFVVVWTSYGSGGSDQDGYSVQGQRFASNGVAQSSEFQINSYTTSAQRFPAVAFAATGEFVVVWHGFGSGGTDSSLFSVHGQRFAADGDFLGAEFQVNSYTTGVQRFATVAVGSSGDFVVAWSSTDSSGTDSDGYSVQGQRYASDGMPLGSEFQVNSYTTGDQGGYFGFLGAAVGPGGESMIVWHSDPTNDGENSLSIQGRRYAADGTPLAEELQVNSYTTGNQLNPSVSTDSEGAFVVVWASADSSATDGDGYSVQARRLDPDGTPRGEDFQVNSYTSSDQRVLRHSVAVAPDGEFSVVWAGPKVGAGDEIHGRWFAAGSQPSGDQFLVNSYTLGYQSHPAVSLGPQGDFVVVWHSFESDGPDLGPSIQGQRFLGVMIFADGFESGDTSAWG